MEAKLDDGNRVNRKKDEKVADWMSKIRQLGSIPIIETSFPLEY
jgi:hypothetical protein